MDMPSLSHSDMHSAMLLQKPVADSFSPLSATNTARQKQLPLRALTNRPWVAVVAAGDGEHLVGLGVYKVEAAIMGEVLKGPVVRAGPCTQSMGYQTPPCVGK
eukprot:1153046-Pelagomonas_calceolata.AAC.3